ncbi:MAG: sel1 repeat family protein, partial [Rhodospirillaceae bacterium]|nr:sel1 repeat family protein [Rhodospirillaceae bacterium]
MLLSSCYHLGIGVPQDFDEGLRFLELAAAQGIAEALLILGVMHQVGGGLELFGAVYKEGGIVEKNVA